MTATGASPGTTPDTTTWQVAFASMLPAIQKCASRAFRNLNPQERQEATQAVVASATVAYARLAAAGKAHQGYATPLARYAVQQYRAGRLTGGCVNSLDVGSACCRLRGCQVESLDAWNDSLCDNRRATPADLAALRVDFGEWYGRLSPRNQQLVQALAQGEPTTRVAKLFQLTAGRVSQLRRELYESWQRFTGEACAMTAD